MLWLFLGLVTLLVLVMLVLAWRHDLSRHGVALPAAAYIWPLSAGVLALLLYGLIGKHPQLEQWLADWHSHRDFAKQVVAGQPDPEVAQSIPLQPLSRVLQRQLQLTPSVEGWYMLALIYRELEAPQVAAESARMAVKLDPTAIPSRLLLAQTLIEQSQSLPDEAESLLRTILAQQPEHDGAQTLLASGLMGRHDYQAALPLWRALLARHGNADGEAAALLRERLARAERGALAQQYYEDIVVTVAATNIAPGGTLFVFLRQPGDKGQPLAARRVLADRFPLTVQLSSEDWLQSPPAPETPLLAAARYTPQPGQAVDQADLRAQAESLQRVGAALSASLLLSDGAASD